MRLFIFLGILVLALNAFAYNTKNQNPESISPYTLQNFSANSEKVKKIITLILDLARQNLTYHYGYADPSLGAMDCSGTIFYLLKTMGIKNPPRSSLDLYQWVKQQGHFYEVQSTNFETEEFSHLQPGDLLFWSGTYAAKRNPNVTHVMIYIGKNHEGEQLMAGSSDGRSYKGRKIFGVSVFDFLLPSSKSTSQFLGYSCIPTINCISSKK